METRGRLLMIWAGRLFLSCSWKGRWDLDKTSTTVLLSIFPASGFPCLDIVINFTVSWSPTASLSADPCLSNVGDTVGMCEKTGARLFETCQNRMYVGLVLQINFERKRGLQIQQTLFLIPLVSQWLCSLILWQSTTVGQSVQVRRWALRPLTDECWF